MAHNRQYKKQLEIVMKSPPYQIRDLLELPHNIKLYRWRTGRLTKVYRKLFQFLQADGWILNSEKEFQPYLGIRPEAVDIFRQEADLEEKDIPNVDQFPDLPNPPNPQLPEPPSRHKVIAHCREGQTNEVAKSNAQGVQEQKMEASRAQAQEGVEAAGGAEHGNEEN
ncbi:hypothetical protein ACMFMG_000802 [Clarireedia jacksonii]